MRAWLPGLLALGCVSCSAAHVDQGPRITLDEFGPRIANALCEGRRTCCPEIPTGSWYPTESECPVWVELGLRNQVNDEPSYLGEALQPWPDMEFDERAAATLVAAFESASQACAVPPPKVSVQAVFRPRHVVGDDCKYDKECVQGSVCRPKQPDVNADRACARLGEFGEPCLADVHCIPSLWCTSDPDQPELGATCNLGSELGEPCGTCRAGLECLVDATFSDWRCMVPLALGAACDPTEWREQCGRDNYCGQDPGGNRVCVPRHPDGASCGDYNSKCASRICVADSTGKPVCAACDTEGCIDGACIDGACMWQRAQPSWPTFVVDDRADGETCNYAHECAGDECTCDETCEVLRCTTDAAATATAKRYCDVSIMIMAP